MNLSSTCVLEQGHECTRGIKSVLCFHFLNILVGYLHSRPPVPLSLSSYKPHNCYPPVVGVVSVERGNFYWCPDLTAHSCSSHIKPAHSAMGSEEITLA